MATEGMAAPYSLSAVALHLALEHELAGDRSKVLEYDTQGSGENWGPHGSCRYSNNLESRDARAHRSEPLAWSHIGDDKGGLLP